MYHSIVKNKFSPLAALILASFIFNILTLSRDPLPWYDEVFFAGITESFITSGEFYQQTEIKLRSEHQMLRYGPVYFFMNAVSIKILGLNPVALRLTNFVFGLAIFFVFYLILRREKVEYKVILLSFIIILFDPTFLYVAARNSRMELISVFFALWAVYFLLCKSDAEKNSLHFVFSGILCAISLLTTLRAVLIILPIVIICGTKVIIDFQLKNLNKFLIFITTISIIYLIWIYSAFSGVVEFINYYFVADVNLAGKSATGRFLGGNFHVPPYLFPLVIMTFLSIMIIIIKKIKLNLLVIYITISILLYFFLVKEEGPYVVLILFHLYLLIIIGYSRVEKKIKKIYKFGLFIILLFNVCLFTVKNLHLYSTWELRDPDTVNQFIQKNIPEHSKVYGDIIYYYSVINNNSEIKIFNPWRSPEYIEQLIDKFYKFDYVMFSNRSINNRNKYFNLFSKKYHLQKVASLDIPRNNWIYNKFFSSLDLSKYITVRDFDYSGVIYKRGSN
ncbi:ArnT family glycosyltransferase [Bacteroidota bacterium]